jgi:hypothetical protein
LLGAVLVWFVIGLVYLAVLLVRRPERVTAMGTVFE